jgi:hypothetical protein
MIDINGEYYLRSINPGHWQISVEARSPYKDTRFEITDMTPGTDRDLGQIRLQNR